MAKMIIHAVGYLVIFTVGPLAVVMTLPIALWAIMKIGELVINPWFEYWLPLK